MIEQQIQNRRCHLHAGADRRDQASHDDIALRREIEEQEAANTLPDSCPEPAGPFNSYDSKAGFFGQESQSVLGVSVVIVRNFVKAPRLRSREDEVATLFQHAMSLEKNIGWGWDVLENLSTQDAVERMASEWQRPPVCPNGNIVFTRGV